MLNHLTGNKIKNNFSYYEETLGDINFEIVSNMILNGEHNGTVLYIIRNAFNKNIADKISSNFNKIIKVTRGGGRKDDGFVKVHQIGPSQFSRSTEDYIKNIIEQNSYLYQLMDGVTEKEIEELFLTRYLESGFANMNIHFGCAKFKNISSPLATFRRWLNNGDMSLMPHEDYAQLKIADNDNFEIANSLNVISFNACIESSENDGLLTIWNFIPDDNCRRHYNVVTTGYPYPLSDLDVFEKIEVEINKGDLFFMNASLIHGVSSVISGNRLTGGRFIGKLNDNKVIYWT